MKLLKRIVVSLVVLIGLFIAVGLFLPRDWKVVQTVQMNAAPEDVYPLVASPRAWAAWGMWDTTNDPELSHTFSGPDEGVGATISWKGPRTGRGRIVFTRADPARGVWFDEAIETDAVNAHGSVTWTVAGEVTTVTWTDEGTLPPIVGGYFRSMMSEALGAHFGTALEKLKAAAEKNRAERLAVPAQVAVPTP